MKEENINKEKHQIPLHEFYRELLVDVRPNEEDNENVLFSNERATVKSIIWGALYLESLVNYYCYETIFKSVNGDEDSRTSLWKLVKFANLNRKTEFLLEFYKLPKKLHKSNVNQLNEIFDLRIRLVHFKEPYFESKDLTEFRVGVYPDGGFEIDYLRPVSPIQERLQLKDFGKWKQQILDCGDWLGTCVLKEIQKDRLERCYSTEQKEVLKEKYGFAELIVIMKADPIKYDANWLKFQFVSQDERTKQEIKALEQAYGISIVIKYELSYPLEYLPFIIMEYEELHSGKKQILGFDLDELPSKFKEKYNEFKKLEGEYKKALPVYKPPVYHEDDK